MGSCDQVGFYDTITSLHSGSMYSAINLYATVFVFSAREKHEKGVNNTIHVNY